ncbi:DEAD/DEAH box helicase [Pseudooceanicola onchidii]|uniref:DEAD/DEAH box helicase n=1 Tax=Pseudooceanicola onchidii TaxID=2562279 RepID=UPI0010AAC82D|nr:DEAD/DEAH box helicase [Pseudooceanicola onchidii]
MNFEKLGLRPALLDRLAEQNLTDPTPIQTRAIPEALQGRDVLGLAQTGTGKTLAFGLPIADKLLGQNIKCEPKTTRALILAPTRELAKQITDNLQLILKNAHLRVGLVVGGASINAQQQRLLRGAHILVATPGRLIDLLDRNAITLAKTDYLVLDEADQMLDLGFIHALRKIAKMLPAQRQTLLFSATMPKLMDEIAASFLTDPVRIEVTPPGKTADKVDQSVVFVNPNDKPAALIDLLDGHRDELALVFTRTKHGADKLAKKIDQAGFAVSAIHGNKSQGQRNRALTEFKEGKVRVLVATDVAARGIDIPDVRHVYNFELPNVADNYVHRIGRTARAGKDGRAVSLCAPEEMGELHDIEKVIGQQIVTAGGTRPEGRGPAKPKSGGRGRGGRGRGQGQGQGQRQGQPKAQAKPQGNGAAKPKSGNRNRRRRSGGQRSAA